MSSAVTVHTSQFGKRWLQDRHYPLEEREYPEMQLSHLASSVAVPPRTDLEHLLQNGIIV